MNFGGYLLIQNPTHSVNLVHILMSSNHSGWGWTLTKVNLVGVNLVSRHRILCVYISLKTIANYG
jgi:hypothetical protein